MFSACIHLGVHDHHESTIVYHESLDMLFQCIGNEVSKSPTSKNSMIVMIANKQLMVDYIQKSFPPIEKNHLHRASLEVVMNIFSTLASPNSMNFVVGSKRFIRSEVAFMGKIMAFKDHFGFKYMHDSRFPR